MEGSVAIHKRRAHDFCLTMGVKHGASVWYSADCVERHEVWVSLWYVLLYPLRLWSRVSPFSVQCTPAFRRKKHKRLLNELSADGGVCWCVLTETFQDDLVSDPISAGCVALTRRATKGESEQSTTVWCIKTLEVTNKSKDDDDDDVWQ